MFKKIFLIFNFTFLILFFSACTLTEPGTEKIIPTASNDSQINVDNPNQININEDAEDENSLTTNQNSNIILEEEKNMQEPEKNINTTATQAVISTSKGDITIKLEPNAAPNTVKNFASKAIQGFYQGLTFHRMEDWVIQGGDPAGNGTGGGKMPTELNELPFTAGSVGVARGGDIAWSNDSQFFICTTDCNWLTGQYTNFGQVIEGMDIVKQIAIGDTIESVSIK